MAKAFKEEMKSKLKNQFFSLNIDEATNNNNDKILNVIVQYYDTEEAKICIHHLGSRKQNVSKAADILSSIECPWGLWTWLVPVDKCPNK